MTTSEQPPTGGQVSNDHRLTSSAADSPASRSVTPASNLESPTNDGDGHGWQMSFAQFDPDTCSWRTSQLSFEMPGLSEPSLPTFTPSGSMRNGRLFERRTLVHPAPVNGSTCWPTPRAAMGSHGICWSRAESGDHRWQLEDFLAWQFIIAGNKRVSGYNVNPTWLDWLMGFPTKWTDCEPSETQ